MARIDCFFIFRPACISCLHPVNLFPAEKLGFSGREQDHRRLLQGSAMIRLLRTRASLVFFHIVFDLQIMTELHSRFLATAVASSSPLWQP